MRFPTIALAMLVSSPLAGHAQVPVRPPEIAVVAQGEAHAVPDRALITLGVQIRGETATAAARENSAIQQAVIDTLRAMGFQSEQISTDHFSVRPDYRPNQAGQSPMIAGYIVGNTVRVMLRDPTQASRVIDATLAKGANAVNGLQFLIADPAPVRQQAILDAVRKGRADAEAMARAAGGTLGQMLEMTTTPSNYTTVFQRSVAGGIAASPIEPGHSTVVVPVTIRWALVLPR